jgi:tetratricopeptide (TPR) repeat protein
MIEPAASDSREVRVFLSSTFRDFSEERELLAKQVFPALNRRARERGVELVEVDLRWGVTQEQVEDGHALEICLKEIERCKPYFIGLLGDSYGSLPQPSQIKPELLEQRPELRGRIGGASYTELEIEHRLQVLRDPLLMGQAFFYFRDPAYSDGKAAAGEAGWRSETPETRQKLELLKRKIHSSGYPLKEGIENPPAIAALIEADLWALIDQRFPEGEAPDALEKEERKHADYRRARIGKGQYIGGEGYLQQLESWIEAGQQQILITGKSGAGKSALLANWVQRHGQDQPQDVIYCHHLGCTNDASALRPLLARLIQSASRLLEAEGVIQEELAIPNDWWELVAKVAETLQVLGRWAVQNHRRWIWVLDGLDRLAPDDQKVLPWLPQTLPAGIQVVASALPSSALPCSAMGILQERQYTTLTIGPLQRPEQERLIESYLKRFSRQLESRFVEQVLSHPLADSPLFLRVLLEELRQCGRFDTLNKQLGIYCSAQTVDDLYERVLERLENDGHGDAVRKVLTALWASRAGLTETELLKIRQLAPLQWAPIDLALEKAFGRNGNRLVFDHDYLRIAVQDRYLPSEEDRRQAHSELADWFAQQQEWDERKAEEWPWQLQGAGRVNDLRRLLLSVSDLYELSRKRDNREVINYWRVARAEGDGEIDELIYTPVEEEIERRKDETGDLIRFANRIAALLDEAGLYRELLLRLRSLSLELEESKANPDQARVLARLSLLAKAYRDTGNYQEAKALYERCLKQQEELLGPEHNSTLWTASMLANVYANEGNYKMAEALYRRVLIARERLLGKNHPRTLTTLSKIGYIYDLKDQLEKAEKIYGQVFEARKELLGSSHRDTLTSMRKLASIYRQQDGKHKQAESLYKYVLVAREEMLGPGHPETIASVEGLGLLYEEMGEYEASEALYKRVLEYRQRVLGIQHPLVFTALRNLADISKNKGDLCNAENLYRQCLEGQEKILGVDHSKTQSARYVLARCLSAQERYSEAIELRRVELAWCRERDGDTEPGTLTSIHGLATDLRKNGELQESEQLYREALSGRIAALGDNDGDTMASRYGLARCLSAQERQAEAIPLRRRELAWCRQQKGDRDQKTLASVNSLAIDLRETGELAEAEALFRELLACRVAVLPSEDFQIGRTLGGLAKTLEKQERWQEARELAQQALDHRLQHEGTDSWHTNFQRLDLAHVLHQLADHAEALQLLAELQTSITAKPDQDDDDSDLLAQAAELKATIEANAS